MVRSLPILNTHDLATPAPITQKTGKCTVFASSEKDAFNPVPDTPQAHEPSLSNEFGFHQIAHPNAF
jgi:hypothetical protein